MRRAPTRRSWTRRIDWAAVNFAWVFVSTIIGAALMLAWLSGGAVKRIDNLEKRVEALEHRGGENGRGE